MSRPLLLDLFCGAGGSAKGYHDAGFDVVGVDVAKQPRYPFDFIQGDALIVGADLLASGRFAAVHASPPCQGYSVSRTRPKIRKEYPLLVEPVRDLLVASGLPYVIENVPGAPLHMPALLCGGAFGLGARCEDGAWRQLRRHRLFESNVWLMSAGCACNGTEKIGVYGNGGGWANRCDPDRAGYKGCKSESAEAMGIDWMTITEMSEAIPPAYARYIGEQLVAALDGRDVNARSRRCIDAYDDENLSGVVRYTP